MFTFEGLNRDNFLENDSYCMRPIESEDTSKAPLSPTVAPISAFQRDPRLDSCTTRLLPTSEDACARLLPTECSRLTSALPHAACGRPLRARL